MFFPKLFHKLFFLGRIKGSYGGNVVTKDYSRNLYKPGKHEIGSDLNSRKYRKGGVENFKRTSDYYQVWGGS